MLGTFFLICKNFPLFQEICKDATFALVFTHLASSYANSGSKEFYLRSLERRYDQYRKSSVHEAGFL